MELPRAVRRIQKGTPAVLYQHLVWTINDGRIPWNVSVTFEMFNQDVCVNTKTPNERRFGETFLAKLVNTFSESLYLNTPSI